MLISQTVERLIEENHRAEKTLQAVRQEALQLEELLAEVNDELAELED